MVGKKLYWLLSDLDVSERKTLIHACKQSKDKRYKILLKLIQEKKLDIGAFEKYIVVETYKIYPDDVSATEKANKVRRVVDFCIKEIENLKIKNISFKDDLLRNYILSLVYNKTGMRHLQEEYLNKIGNNKSLEANYLYNNYYIDTQLGLKLRTQTLKNISEYHKLLLDKKNLTNSHYLHEMVFIYDRVSAMYIDNRRVTDSFNDFFNDENQYKFYIALTQKTSDAAWVKLAQARFNFEDEKQFDVLISEAEEMLQGLNDKESSLVLRKIQFIKFLHGFHYNKSYEYQVENLKKVIEYNLSNDVEDPKSFFYLIFVYILHDYKDIGVLKSLLQKYKTQEEAYYFINFIDALLSFKKGDYKKAKSLAIDVTNCKNLYFSIWAKLLEIIINYRQKNTDLIESLLVSLIRQVKNNPDRIFTFNSTILLIKIVATKIGVPIPKSFKVYSLDNTKLSPYHQLLLEYIS